MATAAARSRAEGCRVDAGRCRIARGHHRGSRPPDAADEHPLCRRRLGSRAARSLRSRRTARRGTRDWVFAASQLELGRLSPGARLFLPVRELLFSRPPWANPEQMNAHQSGVRWIVSDGAGAIALERGTPDIGLRVWLESSGVGKRSGMSLPLGAAAPDLRSAHATGLQHISQESRYVLREGLALAVHAFERMLGRLEISGSAIDHFIPSVSAMHVAAKLQPMLEARYGLRPDVWRMNLQRAGYVGGVTPFSCWTSLHVAALFARATASARSPRSRASGCARGPSFAGIRSRRFATKRWRKHPRRRHSCGKRQYKRERPDGGTMSTGPR